MGAGYSSSSYSNVIDKVGSEYGQAPKAPKAPKVPKAPKAPKAPTACPPISCGYPTKKDCWKSFCAQNKEDCKSIYKSFSDDPYKDGSSIIQLYNSLPSFPQDLEYLSQSKCQQQQYMKDDEKRLNEYGGAPGFQFDSLYHGF